MKKAGILLSLLVIINFLSAKTINLKKSGIDSSGKTEVSNVIQNAIDECYAEGGGKVIFPTGNYLCGTILLKDNVELHLERGATILGSTRQEHILRQDFKDCQSLKDENGWYAIIYAAGAKNIAITGPGTIDGQGADQMIRPGLRKNDRDGRPRNILFISCSNVTVTDISLRNSGMWNFHLLNCEDVQIDKINVWNHSNRNNDGIDIDGCRRLVLTNSIFDSGDDAICLKSTGPAACKDIIVSNCIASSFCNGIKMGTESSGGFSNINISNCVVKPSRSKQEPGGNAFKIGITGLSLEIVDGGAMEGISVNNLTIEGTMCPIYVRLGARNRVYTQSMEPPETGSMKNITISNVTAYNSGNFACSVTGIPGHRIENIQLNNLNIIQQGGVKANDYLATLNDVDEQVRGYPQPTKWGNLPVCGLFMRHVDGIVVNNFSINTLQPDPRPLFMAHDVHNIRINGVNAGKNVASELPFYKEDVTSCEVNY